MWVELNTVPTTWISASSVGQAVSRRHARLNGSSDSLTLTDLGSSNGTAINGVPCLEGEIMYLEAGDTVILGDARFNVAVEATSTGGPTA